MEEEILLFYVYESIKKKKYRRTRRIYRLLREISNPFIIQDNEFERTYGLPKTLCQKLIKELKPFDVKCSTSFTKRFLLALYFYTNGEFQKDNYIKKKTVSHALHYISQLIVKKKGNEIKFPITIDEIDDVKIGFESCFDIHNTIGVIACTQISILDRANEADNIRSPYINKNGNYCINVEAVCDHRLLFTALSAKFPGSCNVWNIWRKSLVRKQLIQNYCGKKNSWLLGDHSYPLEPWLMTPIVEANNIKKQKFNEAHSKAHHTIKLALSALRSRFRCLSQQRILHFEHEKAANIIYACAILHNMVLKPVPDIEIEEAELDLGGLYYSTASSELTQEAERIRDRYMDNF